MLNPNQTLSHADVAALRADRIRQTRLAYRIAASIGGTAIRTDLGWDIRRTDGTLYARV